MTSGALHFRESLTKIVGKMIENDADAGKKEK